MREHAPFMHLPDSQDLRVTPAMGAGLAQQPWTIAELVGLLERIHDLLLRSLPLHAVALLPPPEDESTADSKDKTTVVFYPETGGTDKLSDQRLE